MNTLNPVLTSTATRSFARFVRKSLLLGALALCAATSHAQSQAISEGSVLLPIASVASVIVGGASVASAASEAATQLPRAISAAGNVVVKTVEISAIGTAYLVLQAADGAQASLTVSAKSLSNAAGQVVVGVGSTLACSVLATGVMLSNAGQVVAWIPNEMGKRLLANERVF